MDFKIFVIETCLNELCFDKILFRNYFTIFGSDRVSSSKSRGGGVLIAVSSRVPTCNNRHGLQCLWRMRLDPNSHSKRP